jgi:hypothetical protein
MLLRLYEHNMVQSQEAQKKAKRKQIPIEDGFYAWVSDML